MKVGDLVKVHPACLGFYVIVKKWDWTLKGHQMWQLDGNSYQGPGSGTNMSEKWMEVISESR